MPSLLLTPRILLLLLPALSLTSGSSGSSPGAFDVVVHAATPGGVAAAVAAGRGGARVLLLEPGQYIGGAMSGGLGDTDYGVQASVIGGLAEEFFRAVARHYGVPFAYPAAGQCSTHPTGWAFEPHVAELVMVGMLRGANVTVITQARIVRALTSPTYHHRGGGATGSAHAPRIAAVVTSDGRRFAGRMFIDASYEGALMKMANVSYTFGREASSTYNESCGGRLPAAATGVPFGHTDQLPRGLSPYTDATNRTLLPGVVAAADVAPLGGADNKVGSYDWRVTLTDVAANKAPIPLPAKYNPTEFELLRRAILAQPGSRIGMPSYGLPNRKSDWKMYGTWGEYPAGQWEYPNATWERQQEIVQDFKQHALSLLHFFRTDPVVPAAIRQQVASFGLCRDEYNRSSDHWMPQLYVRSALRMVGDMVLTQRDVSTTSFQAGADGIGLGAYTVDVPGPVQRVVQLGEVANEGSMQCPVFCWSSLAPFALPYRIMLPRAGEVDNLIVPVAVSASHVAFNAVRMEPTWMILGQAAGTAAAMAADSARAINVTELQVRLVAAGQILRPPGGPPPPPPLHANQWYAWKGMWSVDHCGDSSSGSNDCSDNSSGGGTALNLTALQDQAVLKKSYAPSKTLPPSDVRWYSTGQIVPLLAAPRQASDIAYWLIQADV